jgi:hypothetical protein
MGNLNDRPTVDEAAGSLWEKSADRVFAIAPVARLPTDGKGACYSHLIIASADATEVYFYQIPLDGFDHDQMRKRLAAALDARGSRMIRNCESDAALAAYCAATWPAQWVAQEAERDLAEKFSSRKTQIEAFVSERTKESLASSKIMTSDWRETLETLSALFASDMKNLDASATINQANVRALTLIDYAFFMGVLIGRSVPDDVVAKILDAARLTQIKAAHDQLAEESKKKIAAFDRAMPVGKNWDEVCALVNKDLDQKIYKNGNSARVAYAKMRKTVDKKRND